MCHVVPMFLLKQKAFSCRQPLTFKNSAQKILLMIILLDTCKRSACWGHLQQIESSGGWKYKEWQLRTVCGFNHNSSGEKPSLPMKPHKQLHLLWACMQQHRFFTTLSNPPPSKRSHHHLRWCRKSNLVQRLGIEFILSEAGEEDGRDNFRASEWVQVNNNEHTTLSKVKDFDAKVLFSIHTHLRI